MVSAMPSTRRLAQLVSHIGCDEGRQLAPLAGRAAGVSALVGGLLSPAQVEAYVRDGFVVCSGLISSPVVNAAVESMWNQMGGPPKPLEKDGWATEERAQYRPQRDDRSTWAGTISVKHHYMT